MNLAIIPARGGSKRIPRKNIRPFAGKPMMAHAIFAAKDSGVFDAVIVSTDDPEIAAIARDWGAEAPFVRPAELANDHATTQPVIRHAIEEMRRLGREAQIACCIYPCVPLLEGALIREALRLLERHPGRFVFPVVRFPSAIQRALKLDEDGRTAPFSPQYELTRSQDLEPAFYDAGQFYFGRGEDWLADKKLHSVGVGVETPDWRAVDIDTTEDWERAEMFHTFSVANKRK